MAADAECGPAIHGALADPDDQRTIVRAANPGTGRTGPDPYGDSHHTSVRPASRTRAPADWHRPPKQTRKGEHFKLPSVEPDLLVAQIAGSVPGTCGSQVHRTGAHIGRPVRGPGERQTVMAIFPCARPSSRWRMA